MKHATSTKASWSDRLVIKALAWPLLLIAIAWAALALWIDGPSQSWLAGCVSIAFVVGNVILLIRVRPFSRAVLVSITGVLLVVAWWTQIAPRNDRDWTPDVARLPRATSVGNQVTIENVRNFEYRSETDFTEHWETRTYDLSKLRGADVFFSFWGPTMIAHTITRWDFGDGQHLAISIETRKERGEYWHDKQRLVLTHWFSPGSRGHANWGPAARGCKSGAARTSHGDNYLYEVQQLSEGDSPGEDAVRPGRKGDAGSRVRPGRWRPPCRPAGPIHSMSRHRPRVAERPAHRVRARGCRR